MGYKDKPLTAALLAVAFLGNGCSQVMQKDEVSEGIIEYALTFPDYDPNGLMAGMLPERTTLTFAGDQQLAELSAGMGVFRTAIITNDGVREMDYHLSVLSKKLVAHIQQKDLPTFNNGSLPLTILKTGMMDTIAGFPCHKAIAIYGSIDQPEIELYYTDRIRIADPNWFGPFQELPGVLLRYELVQYGMRMRLDAISVNAVPVDKALFAVKDGYQQVAPEVLHKELAEVLSTFSL